MIVGLQDCWVEREVYGTEGRCGHFAYSSSGGGSDVLLSLLLLFDLLFAIQQDIEVESDENTTQQKQEWDVPLCFSLSLSLIRVSVCFGSFFILFCRSEMYSKDSTAIHFYLFLSSFSRHRSISQSMNVYGSLLLSI